MDIGLISLGKWEPLKVITYKNNMTRIAFLKDYPVIFDKSKEVEIRDSGRYHIISMCISFQNKPGPMH
jgi:hypothetical protein